MLIDLSYLYQKYHINATGVIHIGAHLGQEAEAYHKHGLKVIWIEANRKIWQQLKQNVLKYTGTISINACISDTDGDIVPFNISNNEGQSSSLFEFGTHTQAHPGIIFTERTRLHTMRVDTVLKERNINPEEYDFVNIDIQGAELLALKGMDLSHIRYAYLEVNEKELYKGIPLIKEIDDYLLMFNLHRVETSMTTWGWGDAFYIKKEVVMLSAVEVPDHFKPKQPFAYPGDNDIDFERWYMIHHEAHEGRIYLPVLWTSFYNKQRNNILGLQKFLDTLDRSLKYYTIVQYDDGIMNDLKGLDIKVFSMSGQPMDYPLPLICQDHKYPQADKKDIFCSFVGRNTHSIRTEILKINEPGWHITNKIVKLPQFCDILARSVFTLCPRGYGPTSFRIKEAMQYGSIPVYISDKFIEPHDIMFEAYGIKITPDKIKELPEILKGIDHIMYKQFVEYNFKNYFTYEANREIIRREAR
jgi:FkbM family methyltransferase